ncbi:hypothetical protein NBRC116590_09020 [Pelagimonas sp. KU-00592-HH]
MPCEGTVTFNRIGNGFPNLRKAYTFCASPYIAFGSAPHNKSSNSDMVAL